MEVTGRFYLLRTLEAAWLWQC